MTTSSSPAAAPTPPAAPEPCPNCDPQRLERELAAALAAGGLTRSLRTSHPQLFSASTVLVRDTDLERMRAVIVAAEQVIATADYRAQVLATADPAARHEALSPGACLGYDFHIGPDGPRLIEINTNAGGSLLALALTRAHLACCAPLRERLPDRASPEAIETALADMFRSEWRAARADRPLRSLAIVDDRPDKQFLEPEFELFCALFRRRGIEAIVVDPSQLAVRHGRLMAGDQPIDLVYNRLTDFSLTEPAHAALRQAYLEDLAVVTPHPRAHALYADKRNLAILTDPERLCAIGIPEATIEVLAGGVARTRVVQRAHADALWERRKGLFFKPVSGYGSKAVYRGDKLTKRVWEEILAADYVAQSLIPPAEQSVLLDADEAVLKYDVRNFVYRGQIQLRAARLYQGQTTNFRTPGGGFAPVFRVAA